MKDKIEQYAEHLIDQLKNLEDFAIEQAPLFVQELLVHHFAVSFMITLALVGASCASLYATIKAIKAEWDEPEPKQVAITISIAFLLTFVVSLVTQIIKSNWLQIWLAPRVYLVEYLRGLV